MKINHNIIRGILKWSTFILFAISVGIKINAILKYGGTTSNKDPNEGIQPEEEGSDYSIDYPTDKIGSNVSGSRIGISHY